MKPEPLKDKIFWAKYIHYEKNDKKQIDIPVIQERHIKSAVEWLKEKMWELIETDDDYTSYEPDELLFDVSRLIDKAFEDVVGDIK